MPLIEIPKPSNDVREKLVKALEQVEEINSIFIIADTDRGPWISGSSMTGLEKCYLASFFQAWINRWHQEGMHDVD